ncbi:MAG: electron transport complex subunit E [Gemmatimonadetes bacterium]|nr:MAG: electron transport complex subunit E [Gemmatimonadota bacterium]
MTAEPQNMDVFLKGIWKENPVFVMALGMCPVLAVTNSVINALAMGLATTFVLVMSNISVSLIRKLIPKQVRIATYILIIATFVTVVEYLIQAISVEVHKALGAFISLIVVNCIILGRAEAFASKNGVFKSILDALGMGFGFTIAVLSLGVVREVLGSGTFAGFRVMPANFEPWVIMVLPGGAFFVLGGWLMLFAWLRERSVKRSEV